MSGNWGGLPCSKECLRAAQSRLNHRHERETFSCHFLLSASFPRSFGGLRQSQASGCSKPEATGPARSHLLRCETNRLVIHADQPGAESAEHLRPVFRASRPLHLGGIWVGEDSPIPTPAASATTSVAALRKSRCRCCAGRAGCFADEYHWMDGNRHAHQPPVHDQHDLGRRDGKTIISAPMNSGFLRPDWCPRPTSAATSAAARCRK